jgi:hypothetical protein
VRRMVLAPDALHLTDCVAPAPAVEAMRAEAEPTILRRLLNHTPYPECTTAGPPHLSGHAPESLHRLLSSERYQLEMVPEDDAASLASRRIELTAVPDTHCDRKFRLTDSNTLSTARTA